MLPVGKNIRTLRRDRNVTQDELARALGVTFQSVSRWENEIAYPDIELLPKIAAYFGVTADDLLTERDDDVLAEKREKRRRELESGTKRTKPKNLTLPWMPSGRCRRNIILPATRSVLWLTRRSSPGKKHCLL